MNTVCRLWKLWRNGDLACALDVIDLFVFRDDEACKLHHKMEELGMLKLGKTEDSLFESFPPAFNIGTAIKFANHYGIKFHVGLCHSECRAILPKEKWQNAINTNVSLETLALFRIPKSHDEITEFQGISKYIELAICGCLIRARIAGVI